MFELRKVKANAKCSNCGNKQGKATVVTFHRAQAKGELVILCYTCVADMHKQMRTTP